MPDVVAALLGVLALSLATALIALIIHGFARHDGPTSSFGDAVIAAATLSFGAAAIHVWVTPEHLEEYLPFGIVFAALALFQLGWAASYLRRRPSWLLVIGLVVNAGTVLFWAWSRTSGLPFGPDPYEPESVGARDLAASLFEGILVAILASQVISRIRRQG